MTIESQDGPTAEEVAELQHRSLMATAENAHLRPLAQRETIRQAGIDPDSAAGKTIVELAKTDTSLSSAEAIRARAKQLGLPTTASAPESPQPQPGLIDPNFPAWHPRNNPDDVAGKLAMRQAAERASIEQHARDRAESAPFRREPTPAELAEIEKARAAGNFNKASSLQLALEKKLGRPEGASIEDLAPELSETQPTGGYSPEQKARLADTETPLAERIAQARDDGDFLVASILQQRHERAEAQ